LGDVGSGRFFAFDGVEVIVFEAFSGSEGCANGKEWKGEDQIDQYIYTNTRYRNKADNPIILKLQYPCSNAQE
jgi:hypothetical protein